MQYPILLVGLGTLAVSAPVDNTQMAADSKYSKYTPYTTYEPYGTYAGYPKGMEKESAAKMGVDAANNPDDAPLNTKPGSAMMNPGMKRDGANMPTEEEVHGKPGMAADAWYSTYTPYADYGSYKYKGYGKEVEEAGKEMMEDEEMKDEKMG